MGATLRLVAEHGPGLTLAQVGDEVGLSAATVMQRFGSKRDLMLTTAHAWGQSTASDFERGGHTSDDLIEGMAELSAFMQTPEQVANIMATLHIDLADPEFRTIIEAEMKRQREFVRDVLDRGVAKGDIKPGDTEELARRLQVVALGAMQSWSIEPTGSLAEWIYSCLKETITPWRV